MKIEQVFLSLVYSWDTNQENLARFMVGEIFTTAFLLKTII